MLPPAVVCLKYRQCSVSQEQTFIPKVQVYFADFPYSHCSTKLEVISFGDLLRFLVRFSTCAISLYFQWSETAPTPDMSGPALLRNCFVNQFDSAVTVWVLKSPYSVREKRKLFRRPFHSSTALIYRRRLTHISSSAGIWTCFPFVIAAS